MDFLQHPHHFTILHNEGSNSGNQNTEENDNKYNLDKTTLIDVDRHVTVNFRHRARALDGKHLFLKETIGFIS